MRVLSRSARNLKLHQNTLSFRCLISAFPIAFALHVVDESNCTSVCFSPLTGYNTNGSNIVCHDSDFNSTDVGENFRRCVSCEVQSEALPLSGEQSDLGWALCKLRPIMLR